jgi:hypothetical protein
MCMTGSAFGPRQRCFWHTILELMTQFFGLDDGLLRVFREDMWNLTWALYTLSMKLADIFLMMTVTTPRIGWALRMLDLAVKRWADFFIARVVYGSLGVFCEDVDLVATSELAGMVEPSCDYKYGLRLACIGFSLAANLLGPFLLPPSRQYMWHVR